jgi:hypothetical protein
MPISQRSDDRSQWLIAESTRQAHCGSHRRRHFRRITYGAERHPVHLVVLYRAGVSPAALCRFDSQSGLTGASDPTDCDGPPRLQHRQDRRDFPIPTDESREIGRKGVGEELFVNRHEGAPPRAA